MCSDFRSGHIIKEMVSLLELDKLIIKYSHAFYGNPDC